MANHPPIEVSRKALLVAPSYKGLSEINHLPGTSYDLQVMENVTKKLQFNDVKKVKGDEATKKNILHSLEDLSRSANPRDIVLFYYSGHGYYVLSTKDEGLVPADATSEKLKHDGEGTCITGRDLLPFFEELARKDVKLTVIFDCCYSGQLYRVVEFRNSGCTDIKPRQVLIEKSLNAKSTSPDKPEETGTKLLRGGWTPNEKDTFFYIAACSPVQLAYERLGKGGRLTMAIESVVDSRECFKNVSNRAFFRLIVREFKKNRLYETQTPQIEGESLDTELFGVNKVPCRSQEITVNEVNGDEVILEAGWLQNLLPGGYNVYETTAIKAGVDLGKESSDWLGTVDVSEGGIGPAQTSSLIDERSTDNDKQITPGCLAYLTTPSNIKTNALVNVTTDDSVPEGNIQDLLQHLKDTKILNASTEGLNIVDQDLITIGIERYESSSQNKKKKFWVARRRGDVIVPPLSLGQEKTMAGNLNRYLRFQFALASAEPLKSHDEKLEKVNVKIVKIKNVKPFQAKSKEERIKEGLESGKDLHEDTSQRPVLLSHSLVDPKLNKLKDETGDAFVFQVTNHNVKKEDTVHICVLFYQFDGAIKAIYPPKKGGTAVLKGGDTAEDIFRVFIPFNSLRKMAQPDPTEPEPERGVDTIVVYATSKPANFEALLQTAIETDPDLIARGREEKAKALSELAEFSKSVPIRKRCLEDHPDEDFKWVVLKKEFEVEKNVDLK